MYTNPKRSIGSYSKYTEMKKKRVLRISRVEMVYVDISGIMVLLPETIV